MTVARCRRCEETPVPMSGWLCAACQVEEERATSVRREESRELYMWIVLGVWATLVFLGITFGLADPWGLLT
jgi:hypothetical protein